MAQFGHRYFQNNHHRYETAEATFLFFFFFHNNKNLTLAMTNDIFQFIQMIFGKGKNLFSDAGFFSLTRGINERDIAALPNKFCDRHHKVFKNFGREF